MYDSNLNLALSVNLLFVILNNKKYVQNLLLKIYINCYL